MEQNTHNNAQSYGIFPTEIIINNHSYIISLNHHEIVII